MRGNKPGRRMLYTDAQFKARFGHNRPTRRSVLRQRRQRNTLQAIKYRAGVYWKVPVE